MGLIIFGVMGFDIFSLRILKKRHDAFFYLMYKCYALKKKRMNLINAQFV